MKTIKDLFAAAVEQEEKNEGKLVKYSVIIDTSYEWVSMYETTDLTEPGSEEKTLNRKSVFQNESIGTPEQIQMVYWMIKVKGRK